MYRRCFHFLLPGRSAILLTSNAPECRLDYLSDIQHEHLPPHAPYSRYWESMTREIIWHEYSLLEILDLLCILRILPSYAPPPTTAPKEAFLFCLYTPLKTHIAPEELNLRRISHGIWTDTHAIPAPFTMLKSRSRTPSVVFSIGSPLYPLQRVGKKKLFWTRTAGHGSIASGSCNQLSLQDFSTIRRC